MSDNSFIERNQSGKSTGMAIETREVAEVKAQILLARQFPRNIPDVIDRIVQECKAPRLAEAAQYSYVKGKGDKASTVKGPSIRLMEVITRNWGNCDSSFMEVEHRSTGSTVKVRFWDFETNAQQSKTFDVDFVRNTKNGSYNITDEREKYELMANYGARRLRACMQAGIPTHVVDLALEECEKSLADTLKKCSIEDTREKMLASFRAFADWITPEMLGKAVDKEFNKTTVQDIVKLKSLYTAIRDGFVKVESAFGAESGGELPSREEQTTVDEINEELGLNVAE